MALIGLDCGLIWPFMVFHVLALSSMVFYSIVWLFYGLAWPFCGNISIWTYMVFCRGHRSKFLWSCFLYYSASRGAVNIISVAFVSFLSNLYQDNDTV